MLSSVSCISIGNSVFSNIPNNAAIISFVTLTVTASVPITACNAIAKGLAVFANLVVLSIFSRFHSLSFVISSVFSGAAGVGEAVSSVISVISCDTSVIPILGMPK